ncbi:B3 domain-containing protein [Quillaja saponaria]|uniref:B3 domain-containing protein n=1 Tax=Quillaja saponaria TaxID=32244 RepID=A0AAD7LHH7_QUISA|nr:B3 domain-containing protein [Quillaja saponaria]
MDAPRRRCRRPSRQPIIPKEELMDHTPNFPSGYPIIPKEEPMDAPLQPPISPSFSTIKAPYFHFILSKAAEEEQEAKLQALEIAGLRNPNDSSPIYSELLDITPLSYPIRTLPLFPWEIRKTLTIHETGFQYSRLQFTLDQVQNYIFKHWDEATRESMWLGQQVPIVIYDEDTKTRHGLFLGRLRGDEYFSIHSCWVREFVSRRQLKVGMSIGMYWDLKYLGFSFTVFG